MSGVADLDRLRQNHSAEVLAVKVDVRQSGEQRVKQEPVGLDILGHTQLVCELEAFAQLPGGIGAATLRCP